MNKFFIYSILSLVGKKAGIISTVGAKFNGEILDTGFHVTTPDPDLLFKTMRQMVDGGVEYLILEVTSIGLIQQRLHGVKFLASGVTNITHEHLDVHKTYEQLIKDKAKIFENSKNIILNIRGEGVDKIKNFMRMSSTKTLVESSLNFI